MSAWSSYYRYGNKEALGTPRGYGLVALKHELDFNGYGKLLVLNTASFGDAMRNRVKEFQKSKGQTVDGVIGPTTARELFRKRVELSQNQSEGGNVIPEDLVGKLIKLESGFDPAAVGTVDPRDRGLGQINSGAHPDVTDDEAFDPSFSINWTGSYLLGNWAATQNDWDGALAAYNVGRFYANKWVTAGKPASGLFTSAGKDYAASCTNYVKLVKGQVF